MCDTLGRLGREQSFFAKNSDRSPNEVQLLEYHPAAQGLKGEVKCTYRTVPQAEQTNAVLLSRPGWMWGAEMGVNDHGLCIGNEAVFTRGAYGKSGLTGMDMVRLALERCSNTRQAAELMVELLQTYGQGCNCGYDHDFYYDNAFLIMDRTTLCVVETAGKEWVCKYSDAANISNRLSIGRDGDQYSGAQPIDFRKKYTEPVYTMFSGSASRSRQLREALPGVNSVPGCMRALRCHDRGVENPFTRGSVSSACMHFGGVVGDHTTASMVVELNPDRTVVWSTGTSTPCVSLFKPWLFGTEPVLPVTAPQDPRGQEYWMEAEAFRRSLLGKVLPPEYYHQRDALENRWQARSADVSAGDFPGFSRQCLEEETEFFRHWKEQQLADARCAWGFRGRWEKKNKELK